MRTRGAITGIFLFALVARASGVPGFDQFPTPVRVLTSRNVNADNNAEAHRFRTMLREAAAKGPNFAGTFVIAKWGCIEWAIIDLETGKVYFDPELKHLLWIVGWDQPNMDYLAYHRDSSLLIAQGATDGRPNAVCRDFLQWDGEKLKQLKREAVYTAPPSHEAP